MQDYLNPGIPEGSDQERAENARWERLLEIARNTGDQRPVLTSEYAHCMGNALGNFKEYWDEMYSHPRMLGGFIWDWVDQGIYGNEKWGMSNEKWGMSNEKGEPILYGGDFGDQPNLKAFCLNGVVMADRSLSAKYHEVRHVYSPVQLVQHGQEIFVVNRNHHVSLKQYQSFFMVTEDGKVRRKGQLQLPDVQPGDSAVLTRLGDYTFDASKDVRLNISVTTTSKAYSNTDVVFQFALNERLCHEPKAASRKPDATIASWLGEHSARLTLQAFRAPTDNDRSFGNWLAKDWTKHGLDTARVVFLAPSPQAGSDLAVPIQELRLKSGTIRMTTECRGSEYSFTFECSGELPELPRLGIVIQLPKDYEQVSWYGRGPWENYPDRWQSCPIGRYSSTVSNMFTHYPRPQDNGNHEQCSEVVVSKNRREGIRITAVDQPFSFSVLHYTAAELAITAHDFELPDPQATYLSVDCAVLGLGNSSCGPGVLKKYAIDKSRPHTLRIVIQRL